MNRDKREALVAQLEEVADDYYEGMAGPETCGKAAAEIRRLVDGLERIASDDGVDFQGDESNGYYALQEYAQKILEGKDEKN